MCFQQDTLKNKQTLILIKKKKRKKSCLSWLKIIILICIKWHLVAQSASSLKVVFSWTWLHTVDPSNTVYIAVPYVTWLLLCSIIDRPEKCWLSVIGEEQLPPPHILFTLLLPSGKRYTSIRCCTTRIQNAALFYFFFLSSNKLISSHIHSTLNIFYCCNVIICSLAFNIFLYAASLYNPVFYYDHLTSSWCVCWHFPVNNTISYQRPYLTVACCDRFIWFKRWRKWESAFLIRFNCAFYFIFSFPVPYILL